MNVEVFTDRCVSRLTSDFPYIVATHTHTHTLVGVCLVTAEISSKYNNIKTE